MYLIRRIDSDRICELLKLPLFTFEQIIECSLRARLGGDWPTADGWDANGEPVWTRATVARWIIETLKAKEHEECPPS